jgi:hypothetical protein
VLERNGAGGEACLGVQVLCQRWALVKIDRELCMHLAWRISCCYTALLLSFMISYCPQCRVSMGDRLEKGAPTFLKYGN